MAPATVYIFGNPDLPADSLPLRILPRLREAFPVVTFVVRDPNEEWEIPEEFVVIDTVAGIDRVKVFSDLSAFAAAPRLTMHDFDALANLRYLLKLGKLKRIKIIGVPPVMPEGQVLEEVSVMLRTI